jgi:hypothetical protein
VSQNTNANKDTRHTSHHTSQASDTPLCAEPLISIGATHNDVSSVSLSNTPAGRVSILLEESRLNCRANDKAALESAHKHKHAIRTTYACHHNNQAPDMLPLPHSSGDPTTPPYTIALLSSLPHTMKLIIKHIFMHIAHTLQGIPSMSHLCHPKSKLLLPS